MTRYEVTVEHGADRTESVLTYDVMNARGSRERTPEAMDMAEREIHDQHPFADIHSVSVERAS